MLSSLLTFVLCTACNVGADFAARPAFHEHWLAERLRNPRSPAPFSPGVEPAEVPLNLDDPRSLLRFVLEHAPETMTVFPTERYYYFEFLTAERRISGNIRFTDAEAGVVHVGYFDRADDSFRNAGSFTAADGVLLEQVDRHHFRLEVDGLHRGVVLAPPTPAGSSDDRFTLLPGEQLVADILDESGFSFRLVYHEPSAYFYYVLRPDPLPEPVARLDDRLTIGLFSRFVFWRHEPTGRDILVGVHASSVAANDFYDGPFDQVPPRLPLRERLEQAYPYVKLRGGIDEHGNFRYDPGQRVAIAPYIEYSSLDQIRHRVHELDPATGDDTPPWLPLVHEWKRHFHLYAAAESALPPEGPARHEHARSAAWPANHFGRTSRRWPFEHEPQLSRASRPNAPAPAPE